MPYTATPLTGRHVRLEPLTEAHREGLRSAADDPRLWEHTITDGRGPAFDGWFVEALTQPARLPFAVRRLCDDALIGSTSYLDVNERHRRVEVGSTWYYPDHWATTINPECKLLLLQHAFEVFGVNRVALVTDARNARSRAAIAKLGAAQEGILRAHMVVQGGRVRDTVVFSILAADWPDVRAGLRARLA